jgi:hypothetical protein
LSIKIKLKFTVERKNDIELFKVFPEIRGTKKLGKWQTDISYRVYHLCLLGLTNQDLAIALGMSLSSMEKLMRTDEDVKAAALKARQIADSMVAKAIYKRATGFYYEDTHVSVIKDRDGEPTVITTPVRKYQHPDTGAAIFWLTNRQPEFWQNQLKVRHDGTVNVKHANMDLSDLDETELNVLKKIGLKQLASVNN